MEDIAFNDWPGQSLDINSGGGNAWMPAYGFQTPSALLERDDFLGNPDAEYFLQSMSTPCLYLETIHEETSDDLRSDSDISDIKGAPPGWLATDSETDSVICMDATNADTDCESDREIACPIKRRRQDNFLDPSSDDYQSLSRSSSLLQFESLEKQCQDLSSSTPSLYSDISLDSLERQHPTKPSPSSSSSSTSSDTTIAPSKPWHSCDNIAAPRPAPAAKTSSKISAENLSEDSGYSDHVAMVPKRARFGAYDCDVFQPRHFHGNLGVSCQNLAHLDDESPVEWIRSRLNIEGDDAPPPLEFAHKSKYNSTSVPNLRQGDDERRRCAAASGAWCGAFSVPKNLNLVVASVVVGNAASIALKNWDLADFDRDTMAFKREGSYAEAMTNRVDLSDDESSLCYTKKKKPKIVEFDKKILHAISESIQSLHSASSVELRRKTTTTMAVASTPNLAIAPSLMERLLLEDDERRRSVQELRPRKSSLVNRSTSTSCVSENEVLDDRCQTSEKGVHFSPVVSEVNWRDASQSSDTTTLEKESSGSPSAGTYSLSSTPDRDMIDSLTAQLLDATYTTPAQRWGSGSQPNLSREQRPGKQPPFASSHSQSQPDVSQQRLRRRGSQLIKMDADGCTVEAYVDGDGIQYKHTHLELDAGRSSGSVDALSPPPRESHVREEKRRAGVVVGGAIGALVVGMDAVDVRRRQPEPVVQQRNESSRKGGAGGGGIGGFFSRLASFRFSNRAGKKKSKGRAAAGDVKNNKSTDVLVQPQRIANRNDYIYIPLKGPKGPSSTIDNEKFPNKPQSHSNPPLINNNNNSPPYQPLHHHHHHHPNGGGREAVVANKPPLPKVPPRVVGASVKIGGGAHNHHENYQQQQRRRKTIDSGESCPRPMEPMGLIETDLDTEVTIITSGTNVKTRSLLNLGAEPRLGGLLHPNSSSGHDSSDSGGGGRSARPHKSMEFLLDKQNLKVVEPPENELQKTERVMSEHQLRVQRSLQKLTIPDWYKPAQVPREGFLLKKAARESRWTGTTSKTTSLSSLGSANPSPVVQSPTQTAFVRWSTSKLNSTASSPCASTRSSFNARQPNGAVSPAASVRSSFSYRQPYLGWRSQERLSKPKTPAERLANSLLQARRNEESPEIQTSIKEVTSAIVHYVSGLRPESEESGGSRSVSPRGSQKLCWLESSFVGLRPVDAPQTPVSLSEDEGAHQQAVTSKMRLDLQTHNDMSLLNTGSGPKPSPGSTTLEDVLDSLLGLPPSDRAPSPSLQVTASARNSPCHMAEHASDPFRRHSEGNESANSNLSSDSRHVCFHAGPVLQCRYSRCAQTVSVSSPAATAFKNCHNCSYTYCSRTCRRAHWEKHRKTCLFSRIGSLCRQVIAAIKENKDSLFHLSQIARRGYLAHGSGVVKCFFSCSEAAECFLANGTTSLGELTYIRWQDLLPSEMGAQLYTELVQMCKTYNPDGKMVLYVCICVISETPATGAVKWERQLVSRCAKMRLSRDVCIQGRARDQDRPPETLILTSEVIREARRSRREMSVENVQKELIMRGVSLEEQHPVIFRQLCIYASGDEKFTPITVYPMDTNTGKSFMCIIMLEAEPESLRQVELAGVRVRTVDVLCD